MDDMYDDNYNDSEESGAMIDETEAPQVETAEAIKLRAREFLGMGIQYPVIHILDENGFFLWKTKDSRIWFLQCIGVQARFGRAIKDGDVCGISSRAFEMPLEEGLKDLMAKPGFSDFTDEAMNSYYLVDTYFAKKIVETGFAKTFRQVKDRTIETFVPEQTYSAVLSKTTGQVYHPDAKMVKVRLKVLETSNIIDAFLPATTVRELNLPEWKPDDDKNE